MFDLMSLRKRQLNPFSVVAGQAFLYSHYSMKNPPHINMTGKEGYGYGGGHKYCGSSGTGHCSCAPHSSLFCGIQTAGLPQSRKETYTKYDDIVGNISASGFFGMFFTSFLLFV